MKNPIVETKKKIKYNKRKEDVIFKPVFLIGCGRSGTTILGNTIGKHPEVTYLNERRDIWHKAYPELDIWSGKVSNPILIADEKYNTKSQSEYLSKLFHQEQIWHNGKILLEKLPINNFRLEFISAVFPQARYIYLYRNGLEVAKSIEKQIKAGKWFGKNNQKWAFLENLASNRLPIQIENLTPFEKGLIEWRFSLEYSESFFNSIENDRIYRLSYNSFIQNPQSHLRNIFTFLNLETTDNFLDNISNGLTRRSKKLESPTKFEQEIGGNLLLPSINDELKQNNI